MATTGTRLITLILLLQSQPNQKASELADKLGVSIRTVHRYFVMLDEMGIPVHAERGPYGGFSLMRGYKLPPLIFTPEEAVAVHLGTSLVGEMWGQLYQEAAQAALAKLENVLPDTQRGEIKWARRSLVVSQLHRSDPKSIFPVLEDLRSAMRAQKQISMLYQGVANSTPTSRRMDPYALVFQSGWWYLVGYCHLRNALRTFRVDRIRKFKHIDQPFQIPEDFNIHTYLEKEFKDQPVIRARLRFMPEAANIATGNRLVWESVQENPDGTCDVTLTAPDLSWLASMTLGFANWVTVLEPPELCQLVRDWAQSIAGRYVE